MMTVEELQAMDKERLIGEMMLLQAMNEVLEAHVSLLRSAVGFSNAPDVVEGRDDA